MVFTRRHVPELRRPDMGQIGLAKTVVNDVIISSPTIAIFDRSIFGGNRVFTIQTPGAKILKPGGALPNSPPWRYFSVLPFEDGQQ